MKACLVLERCIFDVDNINWNIIERRRAAIYELMRKGWILYLERGGVGSPYPRCWYLKSPDSSKSILLTAREVDDHWIRKLRDSRTFIVMGSAARSYDAPVWTKYVLRKQPYILRSKIIGSHRTHFLPVKGWFQTGQSYYL